jgi:hypothetical protein
MNILRRVIASLLTSVFIMAVLATALVWGLLSTLTAGPLDKAIGASRAGERLPVLLTAQLTPMLEKLPLTPKGFTVNQLVAEALPPAQVESLLKQAVSGNLAYIRGESATVAPVDLSPSISGVNTALVAHLPPVVGKMMEGKANAAFAALGLDKGLAISAGTLKQAGDAYAALRMAAEIALAAILLIFGLIFLIAPHGIRGRLKYAGIAALVAGIVTAAVGAALSAIVKFAFSQLRNVPTAGGSADVGQLAINSLPPEVMDAIKDFGSSLGSSLGTNVLIYGAIVAALGIVCLVIMAFVGHKPSAPQPAPALRTLPSAMYDQPPES